MPTYSLVNSKLLNVQIAGDKVYAKRGAMIAYKGEITFTPSLFTGGGITDVAARGVTGEGFYVMSAVGRGEVFYGHMGKHVTVIPIKGETMQVEAESVLAFDERLRTGTLFLGNQGGISGVARGAMTGQGLFTTTFEGQGEIAILSEGNAIGIDVTNAQPVFVDPQAYIGCKGQLSSSIHTDMGWKNLIGQGSGESFQLKFQGQGTVYIQASER
jgi:uncharacterized protein (AIM24 family)